jgi:hypothetical protein
MNNFAELSGGVINTIDNITSDTLENKFAYITIVVLVLLYGSLSASKLTKNIVACFDNPICRLLFLGFLYYISTKNVSLAILILASVIFSICNIHKEKQNLIIVALMRRRISNHKRRKHQLKLLRRRKALKLKLLLKKLMIIMRRRALARRRQLTPKVNKIMDKATQMSKDLGETTPKIIKQIKIDNNVAPVVPKEIATKSLIITSEAIEKLINTKQISKDDAYSLSKLTREKLLSFIRNNEFVFIKDNIVPDNLIINIVRRLNKEKQAATVVTASPVTASPVTASPVTASPGLVSIVTSPSVVTVSSIKSPSSVSSVSSPSSISAGSKSPVITITDTKSASSAASVSSDVKKPSIIFPKKN